MKDFQRLKRVAWSSEKVELIDTFKVNPISFKLEKTQHLADENGSQFRGFTANQELRDLFEKSKNSTLTFRELARALKKAGGDGIPGQVISELLEQGFLTGFDSNDSAVAVENPLRFRGVGAKDPLE